MKIGILGSGLVGKHIAKDLFSENGFSIKIADRLKKTLDWIDDKKYSGIERFVGDLTDKTVLKNFLSDIDIAVNAVPGSIGFNVLKNILINGKNVVDIAFYGEDPFKLDKIAKDNGVTCIVDMGVAPGMSNVFVGMADSEFDELTDISIYVGGLPKERKLPFEYQAVFSPSDVIEEYTRTARVVENGKIVLKEPLTEPEFLNFEGIGTLEAFNSDGLRTLAKTIKAENMKEKTLRYPGHREKMKLFLETGLFNKKKIEIGGQSISPLEVISHLLFKHWNFSEKGRDFTVMRILIRGINAGKKLVRTIDLFDEFDEKNMVHSMARTTGYTASMGVRLLSEGLYMVRGVSPPEFIGRNRAAADYIIRGLKERNITFSIKNG